MCGHISDVISWVAESLGNVAFPVLRLLHTYHDIDTRSLDCHIPTTFRGQGFGMQLAITLLTFDVGNVIFL